MKIYRLRELDFLRGIAIILVLFRHIPLFKLTTTMGWIGVDLFFVLSGFLVSGLLFKEYLKFGNINPKLFLIRRGFKIYPIYYLFYIAYLIPILYEGSFDIKGFLADMTFTQNYVHGWGYACAATWSLAVEEHFYFGFAFALWLGLKFKKIKLEKGGDKKFSRNSFEVKIIAILLLCLFLRLFFNQFYGSHYTKLFTTTQFRIDSLLMGVLISYFYYFHLDYLRQVFWRNKLILLVIFILGLVWTPFIDPVPSFFVQTIGFTLLYLSFGILLLFFLLKSTINELLDGVFSAFAVDIVSKIGFCSYSIYIIHILVISICESISINYKFMTNDYVFFVSSATLSVLIGMLMTYKIEDYFLSIRNKYFPGRV